MDVRVIDCWRNVTFVPPKGLGAAPTVFVTLDRMLAGLDVDSGQIEIECDQEFMDEALLQAGDASESSDPVDFAKPETPWKPGHVATYKGVPMMVTGEPAPSQRESEDAAHIARTLPTEAVHFDNTSDAHPFEGFVTREPEA